MASEIVAVVAAVASVGAAGVAAWGAGRAASRADGIDRRRHAIEAHDARVESFRAAHTAFLEAIGGAGQGPSRPERIGSLGPVLVRCEVLATHPLATADVTKAAEGVTRALTDGIALDRSGFGEGVQEHQNALRAAARAVFVGADAERAQLVDDLTAPPWWRRRH